MSAGRVVYERTGVTARVTFDRPEARNAMTWPMYAQLSAVLDDLEAAAEVRVVVFRGAGGRAFVAGTDIAQFASFATADDGLAYERRIDEITGRIEALPMPTVAVVDGYAVGGGLALACACDLRICTPESCFGVPIARTVGNCLSMANMARLVALLGASRVKAMLLTADLLPAHEARAAGFVLEIVDADRLSVRVDELCGRLAGSAPITVRVTKEAVRRILAAGLPPGEDLLREVYGSEDFREGVRSFVEKRAPVWKGR